MADGKKPPVGFVDDFLDNLLKPKQVPAAPEISSGAAQQEVQRPAMQVQMRQQIPLQSVGMGANPFPQQAGLKPGAPMPPGTEVGFGGGGGGGGMDIPTTLKYRDFLQPSAAPAQSAAPAVSDDVKMLDSRLQLIEQKLDLVHQQMKLVWDKLDSIAHERSRGSVSEKINW